jgi:hypothetical protein
VLSGSNAARLRSHVPNRNRRRFQGRKKWLLPLRVFKQNDKVVTHARVSYYRPEESTRGKRVIIFIMDAQ